jgi:hypothetical protein
MKEYKKWVAALIGAAVIVALVWYVSGGMKQDEAQESASPSVSASVVPTVTGGTGTSSGAMPKSYTDAIARYEGARFQFDQYCQTKPTLSSFKNGATVMLDNRSGDARAITIGTAKYNLAGYGWRIVTLSSKTLPTTISVNCGSAVNVAKIQLYK